MLDTEGGFTRADTIAVIGKRIGGGIIVWITLFVKAIDLAIGVALKLSAFPRKQDIRAVGIGFANLNRIADCVILNAIDSAKESELVAPRTDAVGNLLQLACTCPFSQGNLFLDSPARATVPPDSGGGGGGHREASSVFSSHSFKMYSFFSYC